MNRQEYNIRDQREHRVQKEKNRRYDQLYAKMFNQMKWRNPRKHKTP